MNKPWFEKKRFGWGYGLPLRWQGWATLILFVAFIASLDFITTDKRIFIPLVVLAVAVFFIVARVTSGKPEWSTGKGYDFSKKRIVKLAVVMIAVILIIVISQIVYLKKAHRTFENYYHFRGCVALIEKTDTYGICQLPSSQIIKIVEINNKWYLEGDGPRVF
ncbi:MAG: hypothetical protein JWM92_406 [Candidatus Nomurabacteria bacterium]|nr:hypothetical protein [Candidatus Nomurabacteria bacterium]